MSPIRNSEPLTFLPAYVPEGRTVKLLIYSHFFAPSFGGVEAIVLSLARGLQEMRQADGREVFDLTLVTQTPRGNFDDSNLPFSVERCPSIGKLFTLIQSVDVVHIAGPSFMPMLLSWLARKPFVIEHHTYQAICPNGLLIHEPERSICPGHFQLGNYGTCLKCRAEEISKSRSAINLLSGFARRALTRRAAVNIAVTEHVSRRLMMPHAQVIQHGIDPEEIQVSAEPSKVCFAYVGRFVPEKGIPIFVEALALMKKQQLRFEVKLIGDGPERQKIESLVAAKGLNEHVKMTGYLSGRALADELASVSVVVMPSLWEETAGLAAIEQMMRGRVVVGSNVGGLAEIVDDAGLRFPMGSAVALSEALRKLIEDTSLLRELGVRALERARLLFPRSRMLEKHALIYRELAEG